MTHAFILNLYRALFILSSRVGGVSTTNLTAAEWASHRRLSHKLARQQRALLPRYAAAVDATGRRTL